MRAELTLCTDFHRGPIDPRVYGGFLEHLGRAIYGGVYDPGNPLSDEHGYRRDVLDVLKPLGFTTMRYPGGNFVSAYDWRDGVGPRELRPARPDFAWRSVETNQFGTDEFLHWCERVGTEPMMAVNLGTAPLDLAAHLIEYTNLDTPTHYAQLRRKHGREKPYGIKLWCLGNEMDGPWQAGHVPADVYATRAGAASRLLKGMDPSIQTVLCGSSARGMPEYMQWDRVALEYCWDTVDFISAHRYSTHPKDKSTEWYLAEGVEIERVLEDYAGLIAYVKGRKRSDKNVYLSFDEWNVWYRARGSAGEDGTWKEAPPLLEEWYNLEDALVVAQYLNAFIRRADVVKSACLAQIVNVIAPIMTRRDGLLLQTIYHPIRMIRQRLSGVSLTPLLHADTLDAEKRGKVPAIDVAASFDASSRTVAVSLVNRSVGAFAEVAIKLRGDTIARVIDAEQLGGLLPTAANTWDKPDVVTPRPASAKLQGDTLRVAVPSCGTAVVRFALG